MQDKTVARSSLPLSEPDKSATVAICVPTLNAARYMPDWFASTLKAISAGDILVLDSSSSDRTVEIAQACGCQVETVLRHDFDHGGTRNKALDRLEKYDVIVFMTQDALLADTSALANMIALFENPDIGAVYGRQLPHSDATAVAAHARYFNYPTRSHTVSRTDIPKWGIKSAFLSNSFTAYRREALLDIKGFPEKIILGEDMAAGARMLAAGWQLSYCAEACVYHSHNYGICQEFKRYFDIGVLHARESWILAMTGRAEGEGKRFVISEIGYLLKHSKKGIPGALVRSVMKYLGYFLGSKEKYLPVTLKKRISMSRHFWVD